MIYPKVALVIAALLMVACSGDEPGAPSPSTGSGAGGSGAGSGAGNGTGAGQGTGATGAGGAGGVIESGEGGGCSPPAEPPSAGSCVSLGAGQGPEGNLEVECNPVTGEPCFDDLACDLVFLQGEFRGFQCYPPPNLIPICGGCDSIDGPFCQNGMTCWEGVCRRYCCGDDDCGPGAFCVISESGSETFPGLDVGVCFNT